MTEYTVEFVGTGETITCSDKETILKRCIEAGIAQEYSCRVGMCPEEEAEDYALTCMARPLSDLRLERGKYPPSIENDIQQMGGEATADD